MATIKKTAVPKKVVETKKKKPAAEPVKEAVKEPAKKPAKEAVKKAVKKTPAAKKPAETPAEIQAPGAEKLEVITKFRVKDGDTGSPEVQVALLTKRIEKLVFHLKSNPSDNHSRRGLLGIVSKRRRLLNYLEKKDAERYKDVTVKLGLNKK